MAPQKRIDDVLLRYNIVSDYKQVKGFMNGVLSGPPITTLKVRRSQFMKLVYKGVLRETIVNMIAFNNLGADTSMIDFSGGLNPQPAFPFSHQVQKYQRFVLYRGIKTKNSQGQQDLNQQEDFEKSEACKQIMGSLQSLKYNKAISLDKCKVELAEHQEWIRHQKAEFEEKNNIISNLDTEELQLEYLRCKSDGQFEGDDQRQLREVVSSKLQIKKFIDEDARLDYRDEAHQLHLAAINKEYVGKLPQLAELLKHEKSNEYFKKAVMGPTAGLASQTLFTAQGAGAHHQSNLITREFGSKAIAKAASLPR